MLNALAKEIYESNKAKGFWPDDPKDRNVGELIALIHSEISEALEAVRSGYGPTDDSNIDIVYAALGLEKQGIVSDDVASFKDEFETRIKNKFNDELADVVIRVLDLCGAYGIDIDAHIELKLAYNRQRPHLHGRKF